MTESGIAGFPALVLLLAATPLYGQQANPLFEDMSLLEVTISAPFRKIMKERDEELEHQGVMRYLAADGSTVTLDLRVRTRGKYRARADVCDFAPLRINFRKKQVAGTLFEGQDKLKLVTHCESAGKAHEQYVLKEHLSYRFMLELTDLAFRTRLLRVTYEDSDEPGKTRTNYAFLIEHEDDLAARVDTEVVKVRTANIAMLDAAQTNLVSVFSYFIGNTDFSARAGPKEEYCCHNAILLQKRGGLFLPVPYDFDMSGMVNPPYASPNPRFGIERVTERYYRGLCRDTGTLDATFQLFIERREHLYSLVDGMDGLSKRHNRRMKSFMDRFYRDISDPKRVQRKFIRTCSE